MQLLWLVSLLCLSDGLVFSANAQAPEVDPYAPAVGLPPEIDPFAPGYQAPPPPPPEDPHEIAARRLETDVSIIVANRNESPEDYEKFRALDFETMNTVWKNFLERYDQSPHNYSTIWNVFLHKIRSLKLKMEQFDEDGISYDYDLWIDSILSRFKSNEAIELKDTLVVLRDFRDQRVYDYIAANLNHVNPTIREIAKASLPTTKPIGVATPVKGTGEENGKLERQSNSPLNSNPETVEQSSKSKIWVIVLCIAFGAILFTLVNKYISASKDT